MTRGERFDGCFASALGHYVRDEKVLDLPTAKFQLLDRDTIRPGAFADLVVFDPARIDDVATSGEPRQAPAGIRAVYVNGTAVARDGRHTGARPGRGLRRGR